LRPGCYRSGMGLVCMWLSVCFMMCIYVVICIICILDDLDLHNGFLSPRSWGWTIRHIKFEWQNFFARKGCDTLDFYMITFDILLKYDAYACFYVFIYYLQCLLDLIKFGNLIRIIWIAIIEIGSYLLGQSGRLTWDRAGEMSGIRSTD